MSYNPSSGLEPSMTDSEDDLWRKVVQLTYNAFSGTSASPVNPALEPGAFDSADTLMRKITALLYAAYP